MLNPTSGGRFDLDIAATVLSAGLLGLVLALRPDDTLLFVLFVVTFAVLTVVSGARLVRTLRIRSRKAGDSDQRL